MSIRFNPGRRLILVRADLQGPSGAAVFRMVLDTGSTRTVLDRALSDSIGIVPDPNRQVVTMESATGFAQIPRGQAEKIASLEQEQQHFNVLIHDYSASRFDGVLGLDFLRGQQLTIDFRQGLLTLA